MRVLFIVQGEGRGHLTQALAVRAILEKGGHEVVGVLAGRVHHRTLPGFFVEKIGARVEQFGSPGFSIGKDNRSIRPLDTVIENVARAPVFRRGLRTIDRAIDRLMPDLVMTFYEPLAGVYQALYSPSVPFIAVGHQYMFEHPAYSFAPGGTLGRRAITMFTRLTSLRASWKLALSLYPAPDLRGDRLTVVPPLLREEVLTYADREVEADDFYLIYLLNRGYADQVIAWHELHPRQRLECFWDHPDVGDVVRYDDTLTFHRLHDTKFLDLMARCRGLVCTAGFESACEALFLGKPVLAVPVEGHYEQQCNAYEVEHVGAGVHGRTFDLDLLGTFVPEYDPPREAFRAWLDFAEERVLDVVDAVGRGVAAA